MILTAIGGVMAFKGQQDQAKAMKSAAQQQAAAAEQAATIGNMNAANIEAETAESAKRERVAANEATAERKARIAASGGTATGSSKAFLDEQTRRQDEYIGWLKKSGASQAAIAREEGQYSKAIGMIDSSTTKARAKATKTQSYADLAGSAGDVYSMYKP